MGYIPDTQSVGLPARQEDIHTFLGGRLLAISSRNLSTPQKVAKIGLSPYTIQLFAGSGRFEAVF